jgi:putative Mg2+ transporter-C (MgtC) family protein
MNQFFLENDQIILSLALAVFLGMLIGAERLLVHKEAGMKTHALVSMGAALFVIISEIISTKYMNIADFDPTRIASQIVVGIGFLGAGLIMLQGNRLSGLTTAGGMWVTAAIGMAAGFKLYSLATLSTVLVLFIFIMVNILEKPVRRLSDIVDKQEK